MGSSVLGLRVQPPRKMKRSDSEFVFLSGYINKPLVGGKYRLCIDSY